MNKYTIVKARTITLLIGVAAALAGTNAALAQGTLTAAKVSDAPKAAALAADPAWAKAGRANASGTTNARASAHAHARERHRPATDIEMSVVTQSSS